jgi:hypothetical protein
MFNTMNDFDFDFHRLLHGVLPPEQVMRIGKIPYGVALPVNWRSREVYLTSKDAQKIRFHQSHGMTGLSARSILKTVEDGDYYKNSHRGTDLQLEVVFHDPLDPKCCHFLVLARDKEDRGFFVRTFYRANNMTRSKLKQAERLLWQSKIDYFKGIL